jgi:hypothetical protein
VSIESVAEELRNLRRRIDAQTANTHTWPTKEEELAADLDRYDRRLLKVAAMLRVEAPSGAGREGSLMDDAERTALERRLMDTGLELGAEAGTGSQT